MSIHWHSPRESGASDRSPFERMTDAQSCLFPRAWDAESAPRATPSTETVGYTREAVSYATDADFDRALNAYYSLWMPTPEDRTAERLAAWQRVQVLQAARS